MKKEKSVESNIKWSAIGTIGRSTFQLLQISILTRFLTQEAFGLVAMAIFVVQFTNIFVELGMTSAILHKQNASKEEYSSIYWLNIFISIILYIFIIILTPTISKFYEEPELRKLVPTLGINLIIMAIGKQHRTIMQKQFRFKYIAIIDIASFLIGFFSAIFFALNNFGVYSLVFSTLISSLFANILFLINNIKLNPIIFHFNFIQAKPFLKVGGYSTGSVLLDFFSRETDVLIIGKLLGAESLGLYSLSKQIVLKIYSIINPIIINVLNPFLSAIQNNASKLKKYTLNAVYILATINFPIYLLMIVTSKEILAILYGINYIDGYLILIFYAISTVIHSINNPSGSLQIAKGRTDIGFKWTIVRILIVPPIIFLSSKISVNTVAIAIAVLNFIFIVPIWYMQFRPLANINLKEYLEQFIKPLIIMLIVAFICLFSFSFFNLSINYFINIIIKIFISLLTFYVLLFLLDYKRFYITISLLKSFLKKDKKKHLLNEL